MAVGLGERQFHRLSNGMHARDRVRSGLGERDEAGIGPAAAQSRHHDTRLLRPPERIAVRFLPIDRFFIDAATGRVKRSASKRRLLPPAPASYEAA